jgi:hypothetical protein
MAVKPKLFEYIPFYKKKTLQLPYFATAVRGRRSLAHYNSFRACIEQLRLKQFSVVDAQATPPVPAPA